MTSTHKNITIFMGKKQEKCEACFEPGSSKTPDDEGIVDGDEDGRQSAMAEGSRCVGRRYSGNRE